jgi:hypothetical protein
MPDVNVFLNHKDRIPITPVQQILYHQGVNHHTQIDIERNCLGVIQMTIVHYDNNFLWNILS